MIVDIATTGRPGRCHLCGARSCLCGSDARGLEIIPALAKTSGPTSNYDFGQGAAPDATMPTTLRLHLPAAIAYGVEPSPKGNLVPLVKRRLTFAGVDVDAFERLYNRLADDAKRSLLRGMARTDNAALGEAVATFLANADELTAGHLVEEPEPDFDPSTSPAADGFPAGGRVGDVVAWVNAGDDLGRFARANRALEAERQRTPPRPSLLERLERIIEEE